MYYDDHPPPHFHAIYGEFEAHIGLDPLEVIKGKLPRRALGLVLDWADLHANELRENWDHAPCCSSQTRPRLHLGSRVQ